MVKLWSKSSRSYSMRRARDSRPRTLILRPAWVPPAAHVPQPAQAPPPQSAPLPTPVSAQALILVAPISSSIVSIAPVDAPPPWALALVAPAPGGVIEIAPRHQHRDRGTKRWREGDSHDLPLDLDRPAKRRLTDIGGERCPQFVLYNEVVGKGRSEDCRNLPPAREQRRFFQASLGGNWHFAKTLSQRPTREPRQGSKAGVRDVSTYLFAKVNDVGVIEEVSLLSHPRCCIFTDLVRMW